MHVHIDVCVMDNRFTSYFTECNMYYIIHISPNVFNKSILSLSFFEYNFLSETIFIIITKISIIKN